MPRVRTGNTRKRPNSDIGSVNFIFNKILNAGAQLQKIIQSAIDGDDSDEFGFRIFDLSPNGCNLKIKVESNDGGYPTYVSSKFMSPSEIEGLDDADEVYSQIKSLDTIFKSKTYDEIKSLVDVHFFGKTEEEVNSSSTTNDSDDEDDFTPPVSKSTEATTTSTAELTEREKNLQSILEDL